MASIFYGNTASATLRDRIALAFDTLRSRYAQYRTYRSTVAELGALTDRELADLGLSRSAIRGIALDAAYGK